MPLASAHFLILRCLHVCANSDETSNKVRTKSMGALSNQLTTKGNCCNQAIAQVCAFYSLKTGSMNDMEMLRQESLPHGRLRPAPHISLNRTSRASGIPVRRNGRFTSKWRCQCGCRMLADLWTATARTPLPLNNRFVIR
jgi:hypothetical protein